jgi:hypothetical protein
MKPAVSVPNLREGETKKRAGVERAVSSRLIFHTCSHDSVASHILGQPGIEATSKSNQLFDATKCKGNTTHERLYRNATSCYVTQE